MGVRIERTITGKKESSVITVPASGSVLHAATQSIAIFSVLAGADANRFADIERAIYDTIEHMRENKLFFGSGTTGFVRSLDGTKADVIERAVESTIVTGDVGISINGTVKGTENQVSIIEAYHQLIDYAREQGRLGA